MSSCYPSDDTFVFMGRVEYPFLQFVEKKRISAAQIEDFESNFLYISDRKIPQILKIEVKNEKTKMVLFFS